MATTTTNGYNFTRLMLDELNASTTDSAGTALTEQNLNDALEAMANNDGSSWSWTDLGRQQFGFVHSPKPQRSKPSKRLQSLYKFYKKSK